jgi:hypothetical protein
MATEPQDTNWEALSHEILTGIREWRLEHPKATLRKIELVLDQRLAALRGRMLQDVALHSLAADWNDVASTERPVCSVCQIPLVLPGKHPRQLKTSGGQNITLERSYAICPTCKQGFFPSMRN